MDNSSFKVLLTSTSFMDTEGAHQDLLASLGFDVETRRGPLAKEEMLELVHKYDALLCGDDCLDADVIKQGLTGKLKIISKYGVGLDKIDVQFAKDNDVMLANCPGVNQVSVAEHVIGLVLAFAKNLHLHSKNTNANIWKRFTGIEISDKRFGIVGFGAIGRETAKRAAALGCKVCINDPFVTESDIPDDYILEPELSALFSTCDIISIHAPLTASTRGLINAKILNTSKKGLILVNTSRGEIVDNNAILGALDIGVLRAYLCDVLEEEPMKSNHPFAGRENIIITPHVGSRTYESVQRQGTMAVENLNSMYKRIS